MSDKLYAQARLARVYDSSFSPVPGTPFEDLPASALLREFRLYQSSFLLRDYQWDVEELPFQRDGNLRTDIDPKQAWADEHLVHAPIEIMRAEREELLRIPGVGRIGVEAILRARRRGALRDLAQLKQIGIRSPQKLANYVLLDGAQPARQNRLF